MRTLALSAAVALVLLAAAAVPTEDTQKRDLAGFVNSLTNGVSLQDVEQGILPDFFKFNWTADKIFDELKTNSGAFSRVPTKVLNIPGYANYTSEGWLLHIHAWAYKEPLDRNSPINSDTLENAASAFLPDLNIDQLQPHEQANARNLTSAILSIPQSGVHIDFLLQVARNQNFSSGWAAKVVWPLRTDSRGEVDGIVPLPTGQPNELPNGNYTEIVRLDMRVNDTDTGNATAFLVPDEGVTVLSDVDDVLRVTKVFTPREGLLNTFARNFEPWLNMPEIYAGWASQRDSRGGHYHFHYLTTTPQQATRKYEEFVYANYPYGSFDTRPLNFTTFDQTFNIRETLLHEILETFPRRRFVLVGDTTNNDVLRAYPDAMKKFSNVACILMRNTSVTEPTNRLPYDTSAFRGLDENKYMFFRTPDDLRGLNLARGDCRRDAVPQNVSFGYQNLPGVFDQGNTAARGGMDGGMGSSWGALAVAIAVMALGMW